MMFVIMVAVIVLLLVFCTLDPTEPKSKDNVIWLPREFDSLPNFGPIEKDNAKND